MSAHPTVHFRDLGRIEYGAAWDFQEGLMAAALEKKRRRFEGETGQDVLPEHHLLFCEHPHVYTLGKNGHASHLLADEARLKAIDATFYHTNRGGDITYHGPGQVVGYPILDLEDFFTDLGRYMRSLEEVIIRTIAEWGIAGDRLPGATGVWLDVGTSQARKICAMGVRCSRWVTLHGWALNVSSDLSYFGHIIPCGIGDKGVTSMQAEIGYAPGDAGVKASLRRHFADVFGCSVLEEVLVPTPILASA